MHLSNTLGLLSLFPAAIHCALPAFSKSDGWTQGRGFGKASLRYREVPSSVCELDTSVKSYSGYVDISEHVHIFFWFFEARNQDPRRAPLTAWISGGPGDSSMSELFTEHGPCRIHLSGKTVAFNPFSWNNYSNVIYIDQPVHVGFSYTELIYAALYDEVETDAELVELKPGTPCPDDADICGNFSRPDTSTTANSTLTAAPNFWITLQAFMATFPRYSSHGFHFASESYGGHFVPVFSKYILDQNDKYIPDARHIDLRSILVGNGWFSPQLGYEAFYTFGFARESTYGLKPLGAKVERSVHHSFYDPGECLDQLKKCEATGSNQVCRSADHYCLAKVEEPWISKKGRDINDVREIDSSPFPNEFYADTYLQLPKVRRAIGAYQTYVELNPTVSMAFDLTGDDAREFGIVQILRDLAARGIRVTLHAGDSDYECNWYGVEKVSDAVAAPGFDAAGYEDIRTPDGVVHGQVKQSGVFSFARVYEAGHAVGAFQPLLLQTIFARTVAGTDLATGCREATAQYRSVGSQESRYREGRETVQDHKWGYRSTYNYTSNKPTSKDFQPTWSGSVDGSTCCR